MWSLSSTLRRWYVWLHLIYVYSIKTFLGSTKSRYIYNRKEKNNDVLLCQLCYLYADMHKQTNAKESRRFFMEFHSLFMDRTAVSFFFSSSDWFLLFYTNYEVKWLNMFVVFLLQNLKVPVPETVSAELGKYSLLISNVFSWCTENGHNTFTYDIFKLKKYL